MTSKQVQNNTLLATLIRHLRDCTSTNDGVAPPIAILWTDPKQQWRSLIPMLQLSIPELLVYGDYDPESGTGPAIWLRCMIDRVLETLPLPEDTIPILYLPGIGRQQLRAGEECTDKFKPLVELMYRGVLWLQKGGRDWTVTAFITSNNGLGLELSGDNLTTEALLRALSEFSTMPTEQFRGQRLDDDFFNKLVAPDVERDLLMWMSDPAGTRERFDDDRWAVFLSQCRQKFHFDPETDGETTAGQKLGVGEGVWGNLWKRFEEAPTNYTGIPDLLRRSKPAGLIFDKEHWPDENDACEEEIRRELSDLIQLSHKEACSKVLELESKHAVRRSWVWNNLGQSPLAQVLVHLAELATRVSKTIGGQSSDDIARTYIERGWQADRASWEAVSLIKGVDEKVIRDVVQKLLETWLDDGAHVFQKALSKYPLPDHSVVDLVTVPEGGCLLFADGLRYDLGEVLRDRLEARGCRVGVDYRWAAIPTVTATAKPAITPIAQTITGEELPDDFTPIITNAQKPANAGALRKAIKEAGYQLLTGGMDDWPASDEARGWTEEGQIDKRGHHLQGDLATFLNEELDRLVNRITSLLDSGWTTIRIVTDHGWLLLPGGLPKVELPKHLTASKWARCAVISGQSQVDVPTAPWYWNTTQQFATGPGIACFSASNYYAHGGLSVQECLTPDLHVERTGDASKHASIESVTWKGMRCFVVASNCSSGIKVDLRLTTPIGASVAASAKEIDEDGSTSLLLEDDEYESAELVVVLLSSDDSVLAQVKTKVGIDS